MEQKAMRKKIKKIFALLLAFALLLDLSSAGVQAAVGTIDEAMEDGGGNAQAQAGNVEITGDSAVGDMVADALSEEQERKEEDAYVSSLSFNGTTAVVTYNTEKITKDCDLVVAVYAESPEPRQMLASGTLSVSGGGVQMDL